MLTHYCELNRELAARIDDGREARSASIARIALWVLLSAACYYASTQIAWALCFPNSKVSLLFPPHAVLVAVLLGAPTRHWWAYTLAAMCGHFAATQQAHWPPLYALHCEVFDAVKYVSAAAGIRAFVKSPLTMITLRDAIVFVLITVVIVPFGTAFWGAGLTLYHHFGTHYWVEWRNLGISNAVTTIVLLPAILLGVHQLYARRINPTPARLLEAALLGGSIVTAGILVFQKSPAGPDTSPALLFAPIPLFIWAALRFGLGGVSASMLALTFQAVSGTMRGLGPFLMQSPAENVLALQAFLLVMAIPLLLLAVVVEDERRSKNALLQSETHRRTALNDQLRFERLSMDISSMLMNAPAEELGKQIVPALEQMAQLLGFEAATLWLLKGTDAALRAHGWHKPDAPGLPSHLTEKDFPWLARELSAGRDVPIRALDDFPPEAHTDRATSERYGLKSLLAVPMFVGSHPVGVLSMGSFQRELTVSPQLVQRQRVLGNVFGNALVRARSEIALRESEKRLRLAATAGDLGLWLWNLQSHALWATERARKMFGFAPENELTYESFYSRVHPEDRPAVDAEMASAISGNASFDTEYRICLPGGAEKWIAARGEVAFEHGDQPVSVTGIVSDITERRRNALELFRHRQELAHISRISVLGELSASTAHELNQPLTAILSNAQAARRFMATEPPELNEVQEILNDIVSDTKRARDVILHLRQLVKKTDDREVAWVELNEIIQQVVKLLHGDIVSRNVSVKLDLAKDLPPVLGDRIQLQQVLLNLFLNAFDAMNASALTQTGRQLVVRTALLDGDVRASVCDSGAGIAPDNLERIFEPFFTTKANGLGLGLSVCGTIIRAHGGKLCAANNPERGATFYFAIPIAENPDQ